MDDEPNILKIVSKRLELEGYQVVTALDGEEALHKVKTESPDLIVLDLMLPKLDGYAVCSTIKKDLLLRRIPIIMFTAKAGQMDEELGVACGAEAYVRKPFKAPELLAEIRRLLGLRQAGFTLIELLLVIVIIAALASHW